MTSTSKYKISLSTDDSGLGMPASAIGTALAINGVWTIACQLLLLTRIRRRFGIARSFKILSFGWIPIWLMLPLLRSILEITETPLPQVDPYDPIRYPADRGWATSICVNLLLSLMSISGMSNSLLMVLVNFSCPEKTAYGAVNGISTAVGCMGRVVGPSLVSAVRQSFLIQRDAIYTHVSFLLYPWMER